MIDDWWQLTYSVTIDYDQQFLMIIDDIHVENIDNDWWLLILMIEILIDDDSLLIIDEYWFSWMILIHD
jgi:hypothetical protein